MERSHTFTQYESKVTKKGKNVLYLVLKKKTFADEIIDSLQKEVETRFKKFLNEIAADLNKIKLDDEENGLKYIMLKGMINILNQMLKERMIILSEKDKQIINEIFEKDEDIKDTVNQGKDHPKKNEGKNGHSGKKDNYYNRNPNSYGNDP